MYDHVDYFAVNVSSPNTPNLRDLQNINDLREILSPLIKENKKRESKPILIKISPDLIDDDIKDIVDMALDLKIDGIITSNTTCLLYTSPSPRDKRQSRMPSSA